MNIKNKKGLFIAISSLTMALSAMKTNDIIKTYSYEKERQTEITNMLDNRIITTDLGAFYYIDLYNVTTNKNQYIAIVGTDNRFQDIFTGSIIETGDEKVLYCSSLYGDIYTSIYNNELKIEDLNQDYIINYLLKKKNTANNSSIRRI